MRNSTNIVPFRDTRRSKRGKQPERSEAHNLGIAGSIPAPASGHGDRSQQMLVIAILGAAFYVVLGLVAWALR